MNLGGVMLLAAVWTGLVGLPGPADGDHPPATDAFSELASRAPMAASESGPPSADKAACEDGQCPPECQPWDAEACLACIASGGACLPCGSNPHECFICVPASKTAEAATLRAHARLSGRPNVPEASPAENTYSGLGAA